MRIPFSEKPGRHERHFKRRLQNTLFDAPTEPDDDDLLEAQRLDHEELMAFITELRQVVERAVALKPNEESDVVLKLKEDLDRLYETSAGLADEQEGNQQAIKQLLAVIMRTVQQSAMGDPEAERNLAMEEQARAAHFAALAEPLVADLLHPETLIEADQLAATLLSESAEAVQAVLALFDGQQRMQLAIDAKVLLEARDPEHTNQDAWQRLGLIQ
jgi:hypothetical protein